MQGPWLYTKRLYCDLCVCAYVFNGECVWFHAHSSQRTHLRAISLEKSIFLMHKSLTGPGLPKYATLVVHWTQVDLPILTSLQIWRQTNQQTRQQYFCCHCAPSIKIAGEYCHSSRLFLLPWRLSLCLPTCIESILPTKLSPSPSWFSFDTGSCHMLLDGLDQTI